MDEFKSESKESYFSDNLYQSYREYVEFLNDFVVTQPFTSVLIAIPNLVMVMDLALKVNKESGESDSSKSEEIGEFFQNLSYLGLSEAVMQILSSSESVRYVILVLVILMLMSPVFVLAQLILSSLGSEQKIHGIGHFKQGYESSLAHKLARIFIYMFQYLFLPVFTSIAVKMMSIEDRNVGIENQVAPGVCILILIPLVYLVSEYHLLEIHDESEAEQKAGKLNLVRKGFPNNIFDCLLVYLYLILVNNTQGDTCFLLALGIFALRGICAYHFPYYYSGVRREQYYILISSILGIAGLYICHLSQESYIVCLLIFLLLGLANSIKSKIQIDNGEQYQKLPSEEKTLEDLKAELWNNGTFTYVFRELIFYSRKNNSHRQQLLIEILKVKCYELEYKSRGGNKMVSTLDLIRFQAHFVKFMTNVLLIGDESISLLRLLQNKEPSKQIFAHQASLLVQRINENKEIIQKMRLINDLSVEGAIVMKTLFAEFYNDLEFVKEMESKSRANITSLKQKQMKTRLFNKKTCAIFINILDETGKVTKVSKNIPAVLGHSPSDLLGKNINEIIPFTIQPFHDDHLIRFTQKYSKKTMRGDPRIQFWAYNKDFHLQECVIRYNFVMNYFSNFQLSGVVKKIEEENKNVILMNNDGVLEGWTEELASLFNWDEFEMGECIKFNVMALFPTLIKYSAEPGVCIKTVFFRSGKVKEKALQVSEYRNLSDGPLREKQMAAFRHLLESDELIEAYLADVEYEQLFFCNGNVKMKKLIIKNFERIENLNELQDCIIKKFNGEQVGNNEPLEEEDDQAVTKEISMSEYSVGNEQSNAFKLLDANFTLDFEAEPAFEKSAIRLQSEVSKSQLSIDLTDANLGDEDKEINEEILAGSSEQNNNLIENSFSPKLQTQSNFLPLLIVIALAFIAIITWDQIVFSETESLMVKKSLHIINRNRALMIYAKSSFNPNATYVREFDHAKLMESSTFLGDQTFEYRTFLGDWVTENRFYMFNVQIPSTLDRILLAPNATRRAEYQREIEYNFNAVMGAWMDRFDRSQQEWGDEVSRVKSAFTIRLVVISIGSIAFSLFLFYIYVQYRNQRKMTEAFFKFEKTDLDEKMSAIRKVIKCLEIRAIEFHLDKFFYDFVKKNEVTNLEFEMEGNAPETKIKFETSDEAEEKLSKKKLYSMSLFIGAFLVTQVIFIILYSVLSYQQIADFQKVPEDLDQACKLIVLPNLMLADMFYAVPPEMIAEYKTVQSSVLEKPLESVPNLFGLLEEAPCRDCTYLYPVLTTNFRSFYSTFEQLVAEKTANGDHNVTELFYAVDTVVNRISENLQIKDLLFLPATVVVYVFSLTVFFLSIYFNINKMVQENQRLEVFLKYFDEEILIKNKHMNGLFKNT